MVFGLIGADDPQIEGSLDGGLDLRVIVTEKGRAVGYTQIDVLMSIQIVYIRSIPTRDIKGIALSWMGTCRRADTPRQVSLCKLIEFYPRVHGASVSHTMIGHTIRRVEMDER
jgi:hypothetical protein